MKTEQRRWSRETGWTSLDSSQPLGPSAQLVFIFGGVAEVAASGSFDLARSLYPSACVVGCTTAGEIQATAVTQQSVVMTAAAFDHSNVAVSHVRVDDPAHSRSAGERLISSLPAANLAHVFLISDGLSVSPSHLVNGATSALPPSVTLTGGFAGDGDRLQQTHVWCDGPPEESAAVAVGFYGNRLNVRAAVTGTWGPFGPDRLVTRARDNILYELDGRPALNVYKQYLGEYASQLPASGLLFPLLVHGHDSGCFVLRALIGVNESEQSITFAGDIQEGSYARLMRGAIERLLGDTSETAGSLKDQLAGRSPELSILVSCNGRRHVLKQRTEEEIEAVNDVLGSPAAVTGFYSYGEIGPTRGGGGVQLHNETMTMTVFSES